MTYYISADCSQSVSRTTWELHGCASRLQAACLVANPTPVQAWPAIPTGVPQGCKPYVKALQMHIEDNLSFAENILWC